MTTEFSGVFPSLCTPFDVDGGIDTDAQRAVVEFALGAGARGLVCLGLAAEVGSLTTEERTLLLDAILEEVNGRVPVLVGVGAEAVHVSIRLARHAEHAGSSAVVILPPFTMRLSEVQFERYALSISEACDLPVVIQENPTETGTLIGPDLLERLAARQPRIRYVKLERGPQTVTEWREQLGSTVGIFSGEPGVHFLTNIRAGAVGSVPGVDLTDRLVEVQRLESEGRFDAADELHGRLLPYLVFSSQDMNHYNACAKRNLVRRRVLSNPDLRLPAPSLSASSIRLLETYMDELGL